jgi:hypothetical protein
LTWPGEHLADLERKRDFLLDRFEQGDNPADLLRGGVIASQAVLVAVAVDGEGRRQILGVDLANRESTLSWREFLLRLKQRGLQGVEFVVSDDHPGLKQAIREVLIEATFCATRWTICRGGPTTIACRSCSGSTTGGSWPRCAAICLPG